MTDFIFIRHAESANNLLEATHFPKKEDRPAFLKARKSNPELTEDGKAQTAIVAQRIVEEYYAKGIKQEGGGEGEAVTPPRQVDEIWCSYLTRAIETAVAVQDAIRDYINSVGVNDDGSGVVSSPVDDERREVRLPPIRVDSDATEVGGHYQFDHEAGVQRGTPGFTNADIVERWPNALFVFAQKQNETVGWNRNKGQETPAMAEERAGRFARKLEARAAEDFWKNHHGVVAGALPPVVLVITHGAFYRTLLQTISFRRVGEESEELAPTTTTADAAAPFLSVDSAPSASTVSNTDAPASPIQKTTASSSSSPPRLKMPPYRSCDETITAKAFARQNIGNTSLSHYRITCSAPPPPPASSDSTDALPIGITITESSPRGDDGAAEDDEDEDDVDGNEEREEKETEKEKGEDVNSISLHFSWSCDFMGDIAHLKKVESQAEAVARAALV